MSKIVQLKDQEGVSLYPKVLEEYSTTERVVGRWINNKPIYRKVITLTNFRVEDMLTYSHNIANIDEVVRVEALMKEAGQSIMQYPLTAHSGKMLGSYVNKTQIQWAGNDYWSAFENRTHIFIIEYTKTTD